jgi:hypothetical protein
MPKEHGKQSRRTDAPASVLKALHERRTSLDIGQIQYLWNREDREVCRPVLVRSRTSCHCFQLTDTLLCCRPATGFPSRDENSAELEPDLTFSESSSRTFSVGKSFVLNLSTCFVRIL